MTLWKRLGGKMVPGCKKKSLFLLSILVIESVVIYTMLSSCLDPVSLQQILGTYRKPTYRVFDNVVHISFTSCGGYKTDALVKSAILLTNATIVFHIFTEAQSRQDFEIKLNRIRKDTGVQFFYILYDVEFPRLDGIDVKEWRSLFAPCASQRLFYHTMMPTIDAVLYVDTDTLFLAPPEQVWALFADFNATHIAGMVVEQTGNNYTASWYELDENKGTPHYGDKGVNSGVMLINLTRIRANPWVEDLAMILKKYKEHVRLGDQDLLNIYFHFKPELLMLCPCEMNYRPHFCYGPQLMCDKPAKIMHFKRQFWNAARMPVFNATYEAFEKANDPKKIVPMIEEANIDLTNLSYCGQRVHLFTDELYRHLT